ncbi:amino acid ABC transporter permease [Sporolactobacillus laevolacticus]|uniref:Polar amino acid ABC transporter permease n=1 Tax=Sporolactobacillus laevolacticus DSM 442 TaxID=1395513 RepID=V6J3C1_9BACL|nr:amino acid ABC transporter permease [Sporolactobacillus laevolacticus]EST11199.1 polar amino acid ABC transporter permease [Sporolactobacillus laevolacticus DSM 442]
MDILNHLDFATAFRELSPELGQGLLIALEATLGGFLLAVILSVLIAVGRLSNSKIIRGILVVILEIVRGTPLLVQLVYMFYVAPLLISLVVQFMIPGYQFQLNPLLAGILGLGINYGCYLSEVVRASILSIDKGQTEAALALGYTHRQALWSIVIPQATRQAIPVFGNYLIMMIKDTSLLAFITVNELLLRTQAYASQTFLTIESYTILAIAYLILSLPLSQVVRLLEKRLSTHV